VTRIRKRIIVAAPFIFFFPLLVLLLFREPAPTTFDLRDGTQLEILHVNHGTTHIAHFGTLPQKLLFKLTGPRLSYRWVGPSFSTTSQDHNKGTLGVFVRHRLSSGDNNPNPYYDLKVDPVNSKARGRAMFISSGAGEYSLWELVDWTEDQSHFLIINSNRQSVARFQIIKDDSGRYTISEVPSDNTQPPGPRDPREENPALR
jgi:hypothetical protein